MLYISTRGNAKPQPFEEIILGSTAGDGGLYMPESYPQLPLAEMRSGSYIDTAMWVFSKFAPEIPADDLKRILEQTYTAEVYGTKEITPLKMLEPELGLLQLSNGPTLAFKDVALQLLGNLMSYELAKSGRELNVLGATSGDTGSAAAYALRGKKNIRLFMLSPAGRMSRIQQLQMYTLDEPNIFNLVVKGTFDDCQKIVKDVGSDAEFMRAHSIGAVNSINWARIAAQVVYYIYAYLHATEKSSEEVTFFVPSGNFGNAEAADIARRMGLPIKIVVCTNENDVLDQFFREGIYRVRSGSEVHITSSPSMDIASASNFERWMFDYLDRDTEALNRFWKELAATGEFNVEKSNPGAPLGITSGMATQSEVLDTIRHIYEQYKTIIDPHTAVAMKVALEHRRTTPGRCIVTETASAAKFSDTIWEAIGVKPPLPKNLELLEGLEEHVTHVDADTAVVKAFITSHV